MFLFNSFFSSKFGAVDSTSEGETGPARMNLEERMSFRREMLFDSVAFTMEHKGIPVGAYQLRISRTDKRGHSFAVMLDLSNKFLRTARGTPFVLPQIGNEIAEHAKASGYLEVIGVYWRVCDEPSAAGSSRTGSDARVFACDMAPLSQ